MGHPGYPMTCPHPWFIITPGIVDWPELWLSLIVKCRPDPDVTPARSSTPPCQRSWQSRHPPPRCAHETFTQCCCNAGPASATLARHYISIRWTSRVCRTTPDPEIEYHALWFMVTFIWVRLHKSLIKHMHIWSFVLGNAKGHPENEGCWHNALPARYQAGPTLNPRFVDAG